MSFLKKPKVTVLNKICPWCHYELNYMDEIGGKTSSPKIAPEIWFHKKCLTQFSEIDECAMKQVENKAKMP